MKAAHSTVNDICRHEVLLNEKSTKALRGLVRSFRKAYSVHHGLSLTSKEMVQLPTSVTVQAMAVQLLDEGIKEKSILRRTTYGQERKTYNRDTAMKNSGKSCARKVST